MGYPTVNNVPLDQIFDLYVSGTKAALTGYTVRIAGVDVDLRDLLAPIYLGTSAAPTNYKVNNADLNTIFAKKGTAQYALPINGNSYSAAVFTTGAGKTAALSFNAATSGWTVQKNEAGTTTTLASGSIPSGATKVKYTDTWLNAPGDTGTGSPSNGAAAFTTLTSTYISATDSIGVAGGGGTKQSTHSMNIQFQNAAGSVISNTTITFVVMADGE